MTTSAKKTRMYDQIRKHGENLNDIFNTGIEPIALCKKLRRLEVKASRLAIDYCNGTNGVDTDNWEAKTEPVLKAVDKILHYTDKGYAVFVNGDARGFALKIDSECVRDEQLNIWKDWGGYGILAPDFSNDTREII